MDRFRWPLLVSIICLPVAILAAGVDVPWLRTGTPLAHPVPVPDGDREIVWLHTTTNASTWERFVSGVQRASLVVPGMRVDDGRAFLEHTTDVPEVVVGMDGRQGRLRIRWYKLSSYAKSSHWVQALANRDPAPLAIIGGGSSDRARDLAWALARQPTWHGDRPLMLITTATAEAVEADSAEDTTDRADALGQIPLVRVYDGRTFRFCFGNRQMAEAILDFVWSRPELRPQLFESIAPMAVGSGLAAASPVTHRPGVFYVDWKDDPYSGDLLHQFQEAFPGRLAAPDPTGGRPPRTADVLHLQVPFSVGGYYRPNRAEAEAADAILRKLRRMPPQRSLLVVPTVAAPARRLLRTLCDAAPQIGQELVALNGDGFGVNTVLRDGEFAWPVHALPVPLVLFTHNNPLAWDDPDRPAAVPPGYELLPPTSTEDVLHFADLTRVLVKAAYPADSPVSPVARADDLAARLRGRSPAYFDAVGNRVGGSGEYVVVFKPADGGVRNGGLPDAELQVWRRSEAAGWEMTRSHPIHQSRVGGRGE
jgi:hypothetical protein